MKLSPICEKSYLKWINNPNWHSEHDLDRKRFYSFISAYKQYSRKEISAYELKQDIFQRYAGKIEHDYLEGKAKKYSELFSEILDFLAMTKR